jgi:hypothetical protein
MVNEKKLKNNKIDNFWASLLENPFLVSWFLALFVTSKLIGYLLSIFDQ